MKFNASVFLRKNRFDPFNPTPQKVEETPSADKAITNLKQSENDKGLALTNLHLYRFNLDLFSGLWGDRFPKKTVTRPLFNKISFDDFFARAIIEGERNIFASDNFTLNDDSIVKITPQEFKRRKKMLQKLPAIFQNHLDTNQFQENINILDQVKVFGSISAFRYTNPNIKFSFDSLKIGGDSVNEGSLEKGDFSLKNAYIEFLEPSFFWNPMLQELMNKPLCFSFYYNFAMDHKQKTLDFNDLDFVLKNGARLNLGTKLSNIGTFTNPQLVQESLRNLKINFLTIAYQDNGLLERVRVPLAMSFSENPEKIFQKIKIMSQVLIFSVIKDAKNKKMLAEVAKKLFTPMAAFRLELKENSGAGLGIQEIISRIYVHVINNFMKKITLTLR